MVDESSERRSEPTNIAEGLSRRRVLTGAAALGVLGAAGGLVGAQLSGNEIELQGAMGGWVGVAPAEIEGETNPTMALRAGQDYTVTWTNEDGFPHNFAIRDADDENLVQSAIMSQEGTTQTVEFTASEDMVTYLCEVHPTTMVGDVEVTDEPGTPEPTPTEEPETPTEEPETPTEEPETPTEEPETPTEEPVDGVEEREYHAPLSGENEVPPVDTTASGEATLATVQHDDEPALNYEVTVQDIRCAAAAHIHLGGPDENGPVVVGLFATDEPVEQLDGTLTEGTATASDLVGPLEGEDLGTLVEEMNAGNTYVNVHTTKYPAGEIRGQIEPANGG